MCRWPHPRPEGSGRPKREGCACREVHSEQGQVGVGCRWRRESPGQGKLSIFFCCDCCWPFCCLFLLDWLLAICCLLLFFTCCLISRCYCSVSVSSPQDENIDFSAFPDDDIIEGDQQPPFSLECGGVACGVAVPTAEVVLSTKADADATTAAIVAAPPPLPPLTSFLQCFCLPFAPAIEQQAATTPQQ